MRTPIKIGGYAVGLVAVFAASLGVGRVVGPEPTPPPATPTAGTRKAGKPARTAVATRPAARPRCRAACRSPRTATGSSRPAPPCPSARRRPFTFRITGPDGTPVTGYTPTHDKELHLIVVRRDLSGFQHVHPRMAADGTWSVPLAARGRRAVPGLRRLPARRPGRAADARRRRAGRGRLPAPAAARAVARTPRSTATPSRSPATSCPGTSSKLTLTVSRDGRRSPTCSPTWARTATWSRCATATSPTCTSTRTASRATGAPRPGREITFYAEVPSAGAYRLFLDFQHAGTVRTAAFTASPARRHRAGSPPPRRHRRPRRHGHAHD